MASDQRTTFEETPENLAAEEAAFDLATSSADQAPAEEAAAAEPGTEGLTPEQEAEAQQQAAADQQAEPAAEAATEQQPVKEPTIADLLAVIEEQRTEQQKLRDKVFGKVGELQQKIDAVKPAAGGLSPRAAERLKVDFPELHEMLFGESDDTTAQADHAAPPSHIPQPAEDATKVFERRLLARDHKDWEQVVTSPEFAEWKGSVLNPEDAATLEESWNADFISEKIAEFKSYKAAGAQKAAAIQLKQERLDNATTVRGIPRTSTSSLGDDDEEAAMLANYKPRK